MSVTRDSRVLAVEGATWQWNPSVSEQRTHEIEHDPDIHAREFGAVPSDSEGTAFVQSDVRKCFAERRARYYMGQEVLVFDPASKGNTFAYFVAQWCQPDPRTHYQRALPPPGSGLHPGIDIGPALDENFFPIALPIAVRPLLRITQIGGWTGAELRKTPMDQVTAHLGGLATRSGITTAFSDSHGDVFISAMLAPYGLQLTSFNQTQRSKHEAVTMLRTLMRDDQMRIEQHAGMERDLYTYPRRVVGGNFSYGAPRAGHHFDYAAALVIFAHSMLKDSFADDPTDRSFHVQGSPAQKFAGGRHERQR